MTRKGFKREASGRLPLTAFLSSNNARLIVVRSKVNWPDGGSAAAGACYAGVAREGLRGRDAAGGKGAMVNNGIIH